VKEYIRWYHEIGQEDIHIVGGKNASLGEMIRHLSRTGIMVPQGFATTAFAFQEFLEYGGLNKRIEQVLNTMPSDNMSALIDTGNMIRSWIVQTPLQPHLTQAITKSVQALRQQSAEVSFAVRSSATLEDLPEASFAGQQDTFLNVQSNDMILRAVKEVFASLFTGRAISYRTHQGFSHHNIALSVGIQCMVRSDLATSGVMFSLDPESGHRDIVYITSAFGLGESVVQGMINPDEFYVHKKTLAKGYDAILRKRLGEKQKFMAFSQSQTLKEQVHALDTPKAKQEQLSLTDEEVHYLAKQAVMIEAHYNQPMDIEWAKDGITGKIYIVQARPETVRGYSYSCYIERYQLKTKSSILLEGRAVGQRIGAGPVKVLMSHDQIYKVRKGDVLVTDMTDPDWEPIMKLASAIVTNRGGRTCHAAILARELGIPAVVGCHDATHRLTSGQPITVDCSQGEIGLIYEGMLDFDVVRDQVNKMPQAPCKMMLNIASPEHAFSAALLPNDGVGLARLEFIINRYIGLHPQVALRFDEQPDAIKEQVKQRIAPYQTPKEFYISQLVQGIAMIAGAFYDRTVIVRLSDFKSNEYAHLIGGSQYEPKEENPMIGFRGGSRYVNDTFKDCFILECKALVYVREKMGLQHIQVMLPFIRTVDELKAVLEVMHQAGLRRGQHGLKILMMCEVPSNVILAEDFLEHIDGFSIGSNDLTQLTLGLDRDSSLISHLFDERNLAVKALLSQVIATCRKHNKYVGICGQAPSDYPDFAQWLIDEGIDSISLNADTIIETWLNVASL